MQAICKGRTIALSEVQLGSDTEELAELSGIMDRTDGGSPELAGTTSSNRGEAFCSAICHGTTYFGEVARTKHNT